MFTIEQLNKLKLDLNALITDSNIDKLLEIEINKIIEQELDNLDIEVLDQDDHSLYVQYFTLDYFDNIIIHFTEMKKFNWPSYIGPNYLKTDLKSLNLDLVKKLDLLIQLKTIL